MIDVYVPITEGFLGLCLLKLILQRHPIKPTNLKKTVQSKSPRLLPCRNVYYLKKEPKSQQHLVKFHYLLTILSIGIKAIAHYMF